MGCETSGSRWRNRHRRFSDSCDSAPPGPTDRRATRRTSQATGRERPGIPTAWVELSLGVGLELDEQWPRRVAAAASERAANAKRIVEPEFLPSVAAGIFR